MKKISRMQKILFILFTFILISNINIFQTNICHAKTSYSKKVSINHSKLFLLKGEKKTLRLINGKNTIQWTSSNNSIATVNKKGTVTALSNGVAIITGMSGSKKFTSLVTVESPSLSTSQMSLMINECTQLKIDNTLRQPIWKTDNARIAGVSSSGQVVGVSPGTAKITASIGTLNLTCMVTVARPAINIPQNTIRTGDFFQLEITGVKTPIQWKSMDSTIAIVSDLGTVVGISNGTTMIIGTADSYQFGCIVSVESYSINRTSLLLNIGQAAQLQIMGDSEPIIWTSDNPNIASVDSSGLVRAVASGKVNISGNVGGKIYICTVSIDGLTLNYTSAELKIDDSIQLTVTGTTDSIEWQSSDEDVADVENGLVYAYSEGITEISAIIGNRKLSCTITVSP